MQHSAASQCPLRGRSIIVQWRVCFTSWPQTLCDSAFSTKTRFLYENEAGSLLLPICSHDKLVISMISILLLTSLLTPSDFRFLIIDSKTEVMSSSAIKAIMKLSVFPPHGSRQSLMPDKIDLEMHRSRHLSSRVIDIIPTRLPSCSEYLFIFSSVVYTINGSVKVSRSLNSIHSNLSKVKNISKKSQSGRRMCAELILDC